MNINTNISSIITRSYLSSSQMNLGDAMEKLSSGKRINGASDDAAGLAISSRMTTQVRGKEVAMRNANDGISLIQTAESALGSMSNILQRMRELAVQADNGTNSGTDKTSLQAEITQLINEMTNISTKTQFNGITLLNQAATSITLHVGEGAADTLSFAIGDNQTTAIGHTDLAISALDVTSATATVSSGSNNGAQDAIISIDSALDQISSKRAELGALQNRLEFTVDNLTSSKMNTEAARSRVEDADMAAETSNMTKQSVLVQSAIAMLSQANQNPQMVLQLLQ
jgi:flagellin